MQRNPSVFLILLLLSFFSYQASASENITKITDSLSVTNSGLLIVELPEGEFEPASLFDLSNKTLRATPDGNGYNLEVISSQFTENIGSLVQYGNAIDINNFQFEFSSIQWDSFFISANGTVSFGNRDTNQYSAFNSYIQLADLLTSQETPPSIAPLFRLMTNGSTNVAQLSDRVVITWNVTPSNLEDSPDIFTYIAAPETNIYQLVLFSNGVIEINYKDISIGDGIVGIFPTKTQPQIQQSDLLGTYIREPFENDYHQGEIFEDGGLLMWRNLAGIEWRLSSANISELKLETINSVYGDSEETNFNIESCSDGDVKGFRFLGELYSLQSLKECQDGQDGQLNFDSSTLSEIIPRPYEVFHYAGRPSMQQIACSFIPTMGDNYDFIVAFTQFRTDKPLAGSAMNIVSNSIEGIGVDHYDDREAYCSDNRLQATPEFPWFIDSNLGKGAGPNGFDESYNFLLSMAGHELSHRWIAKVHAIVNGQELQLQDDSCDCHWIEGLHSPVPHPWKESVQASIMGGGNWRDNGNGTFTRFADAYFVPASGHSYLDLYLMGLISADEVPDFFLIENLALLDADDPHGPLYSGDRIDITIEDIIASAGPRSPSFSESQKDFNTAFVYVLEPGTKVDQEKLVRMAIIRDRFSDYWSFSTGGVASMNMESTIRVEESTLNLATNILSIPVLAVNAEYFSLELSLSSTDPVEFQLVAFQTLQVASDIGAASFENGVLLLPNLHIDNAQYRVQFSIVNDDPVTLRLIDAVELE